MFKGLLYTVMKPLSILLYGERFFVGNTGILKGDFFICSLHHDFFLPATNQHITHTVKPPVR